MKISEIVAELTSLKNTVAGFITDKTKATAEALDAFKAKLSALETGTVAELTAATSARDAAIADKATSETKSEKLGSQILAIGIGLDAALAEHKIEPKAGASELDKISALAGGITSALSKLGVPADKIPAGKPAATPAAASKPELKGRERMLAAMKIEGVSAAEYQPRN